MQLKSKAGTVKIGILVDATIIASASEDDDDARWAKHKGKRTGHGFKAHLGTDADTALVEEVSITSAKRIRPLKLSVTEDSDILAGWLNNIGRDRQSIGGTRGSQSTSIAAVRSTLSGGFL